MYADLKIRLEESIKELYVVVAEKNFKNIPTQSCLTNY